MEREVLALVRAVADYCGGVPVEQLTPALFVLGAQANNLLAPGPHPPLEGQALQELEQAMGQALNQPYQYYAE